MYEWMPHYYKITDGHGQGAEKIMHAEAEFQQGNFNDAQIVFSKLAPSSSFEIFIS